MPAYVSDAEIVGNVIGPNNYGAGALRVNSAAEASCAEIIPNPLRIEGNQIEASSANISGHYLAWIHGYNIDAPSNVLSPSAAATGNNLNWNWMLGATGSCGGWTTNGATGVVDNSTNSIGDCEP